MSGFSQSVGLVWCVLPCPSFRRLLCWVITAAINWTGHHPSSIIHQLLEFPHTPLFTARYYSLLSQLYYLYRTNCTYCTALYCNCTVLHSLLLLPFDIRSSKGRIGSCHGSNNNSNRHGAMVTVMFPVTITITFSLGSLGSFHLLHSYISFAYLIHRVIHRVVIKQDIAALHCRTGLHLNQHRQRSVPRLE